MAATMDDLIASLSGSMHVSQDGYDIKALQEYLYQTMHMPSIPGGPNAAYRPGPASRSASLTRKPTSLPSSYSYPDSGMMQAYPSPLPSAAFNPFPDEAGSSQLSIALPTPTGRPGALRRTSSYGFGGSSAPASPAATYNAFEADAFAPVWQEQLQMQAQAAQDPWARMRGHQSSAFPQSTNAFESQWRAAGGNQPTAFGAFRQSQDFGQSHLQHRPPAPPAEDDEADEEMDEDMIDEEMDEEEEEERVERVMGLGAMDEGDGNVGADEDTWVRGRRKY